MLSKKDQLKKEVTTIRKMSKDGKLRPEDIVKYSADKKKFPMLHSRIEWEDTKAADSYRLQQARQIINEITFEVVSKRNVGGKEIEVTLAIPEYEHLSGESKEDKGYRTLENIMSSEEYTIQLIEATIQNIVTLEKKVSIISTLAASHLGIAIEELKKEITQMKTKAKKSKAS